MTAIDVARLKLRCDPARRHATQHAIEDALHTEIADDQRLRVVRRLSIGAQGSAAHPARRQAAVRDAWRLATADALHASDDGAGGANCVWFADRAEAEALLLARLLAGKPAAEWFWRLALPGWRGAPIRQFLRERLEHCRVARDDAALLALTETCIAAGAAALFVELIAEASAAPVTPEQHPASGYRARSDEAVSAADGSGPPREYPPVPVRLALPPTLAAVIRRLDRIGLGARAVMVALLRADALRQSPALALNRVLLEAVVAETLDAVVKQSQSVARVRPKAASARQEARVPATPAPRKPTGKSNETQAPPTPMGEPSTGLNSGAAPAQTLQSPRSDTPFAAPIAAQHSRHAGLWLVIPSLEQMGLRAWLAARSALLGDHPARQLLVAIARHHRIALDDPALAVLTPYAAPDGLPDWTLMWRAGLDRWLRRTARRRLHDLVHRPGVITLGDRALDIRFPPAAADIRLRRRALDRDPGWVDWLGLSVRYRFRDAEPG